jgi:hypothetical protein
VVAAFELERSVHLRCISPAIVNSPDEFSGGSSAKLTISDGQ